MKLSAKRSFIAGISAWILVATLSLKGIYLSELVDLSIEPELIAGIRLPRLILASIIGAALSVSGVVLQALFQNPLCEPYTLGVASGAALGAVMASLFGVGILFFGAFLFPSFVGALLFSAFLILVARRKSVTHEGLLLFGVMLSFLGSSILSLVLALSEGGQAQNLLVWLLGDLSRAELNSSVAAFGVGTGLILWIWRDWRSLDALLFGEESAVALGLNVAATRRKLLFAVSMLVGLCVSTAGMIGFVGLVVPHWVRKSVGALHLRLIPLSALWGAVLMVVADLLSRWVARPSELPVGAITAIIGAPLFAFQMWRKKA